MKKSLLITSLIFIVIILISIVVLLHFSKKDKKDELPDYLDDVSYTIGENNETAERELYEPQTVSANDYSVISESTTNSN